MKKLQLLLLALLCSAGLYAQSGYMKYGISLSGEQAAMLGPMMPNTMEMFFAENKSLLRVSGGMAASMMGEVLTDASVPDSSWMILHARKKILTLDGTAKASDTKTETPEVTAEKTGKTEKINGYNSEEYKITTKMKDTTMVSYVWTTKDITIKKPAVSEQGSQFSGMFTNKVEGFPVRYTMPINAGGMSFTFTVTLLEYNQKAQDKKLFVLPSGYAREKFTPEALMR